MTTRRPLPPIERGLLLLFSCLLSPGLWGQSLLTDAAWPYPRQHQPRPLLTRDEGFDTLPFSATQPFFDDFSSPGLEPDHRRWHADSGVFDLPLKTLQMAVDPPSYGALTFDGQRRNGLPYATNAIIAGVADRLLSQRIDLSGLLPADSVILSFYLQPQGRGEAPEATDSFYVYVRTNLPDEEWRLLFATQGRGVRDFDQVILPLEDTAYFHAGFQLRFEAIGGLSGALDHWHLDYVYLAPDQRRNDINFDDRSITQLLSSPLAPYTALPAQHYDPAQRYMSDFLLNLSNLDNVAQPVQVVATIEDPVGRIPFPSGALTGGSATLPPFAQGSQSLTVSGFDDQPFGGQIGTYAMTAQLSSTDAFAGNDTLRWRFGIDSLLAYDDGEADGQFGLNKPWSYGIEVQLDRPDSVTAVWISFVPSVYFNALDGTTTYLEDQPFRIVFWDDPHPDSIISQQAGNVRVRYGEGPNHFERYEFPAPVAVPAQFWVGVQQVNSIPLGVGLDRTYDRDDLMYYDASGNWINFNLDAALMIRPEFFRTAAVPVGTPPRRQQVAQPPRVYPQPWQRGSPLWLHWPAAQPLPRWYRATLYDLRGRPVWTQSVDLLSQAMTTTRFRLPVHLPVGLYGWEHQWRGADGHVQVRLQNLLISE